MTPEQLTTLKQALGTAEDMIYRADRDPRQASNGTTTATLHALLTAIKVMRDVLTQEAS